MFSPDSHDFVPPPAVIGGKLAFIMSRGTTIILLGNQIGQLKSLLLFCAEANRPISRWDFSRNSLNGPVWFVYENKQKISVVKRRQFEGPENFQNLIITWAEWFKSHAAQILINTSR